MQLLVFACPCRSRFSARGIIGNEFNFTVSWKEVYIVCIALLNYKITKIVRALWLAERRVCMRVCKHGCGVNMFCFSRANHASTNLKKFSSSKLDKFTLFTHSFVGWNLENRYKESVSIFFRLSWHLKREKSVFCKTRTDYACKTLRLVRISLLISAIQRVLRFFLGKVIL